MTRLMFVLRQADTKENSDPLIAYLLAKAAASAICTARECIARGEDGLIRGEIVAQPLTDIMGKNKTLDPHLLNLPGILAR